MAATYLMIAEKTLPNATPPEAKKSIRTPTVRKTLPSKAKQKVERTDTSNEHAPPPEVRTTNQPVVHLDIQIHIPADADPNQIDQIFASMAKHLYQK
jgi:hypothetical protein